MSKALRYLRIAFSATCVIVAVLLIVLWVQSYDSRPILRATIRNKTLAIKSIHGSLSVHTFTSWTTPTGGGSSPWRNYGAVPHLIPLLLTASLAAVPWIPWSARFGLRSLLITTTLIAAVLGMIAYVFKS